MGSLSFVKCLESGSWMGFKQPTIHTPAEHWRPHEKGVIALQRSEQEVLLGGARGGGKTEIALADEARPEYISNPEYSGLILRKNYKDLCDFKMRAARFYNGIAEIRGDPAVIYWNSGAVTRLGHWEGEQTINNYIGHEYWRMKVEELTQTISENKQYKMLLGSLRISKRITDRFPNISPQIQMSTNPGGPGHRWVKEYFVDKAYNKTFLDNQGPDSSGYARIYIPFKATDNPHISKEYLNWLNGLPEPLRSAWRDGSWGNFDGQFFTEFGEHLKEDSFEISTEKARNRIFAGLDVGVTHPTIFGMSYVDDLGIVHRLMTYKGDNKGKIRYTHRDHAQAIHESILSMQETHSFFPVKVFYGHDAETQQRLNQWSIISPLEIYKEIFRGVDTEFVRAMNNRVVGCGIMRSYIRAKEHTPPFRYWEKYNKDFEIGMQAVIVDPNNPEQYLKMNGDDEADEFRYEIAGIQSEVNIKKQKKMNRRHGDVKPYTSDQYLQDNYGDLLTDIEMG